MCDQLRELLRRLRRDESGQSLIVIVSAMTVILGVAGFSIDAANWMVRHHDAQVVADSAALAAAQCLATPNQASTMLVNGTQQTVKCSSSTDTPDAQTMAIDYAAANGVSIHASDVSIDTTKDIVTVNASTTTPSVLARVMGIGSTSQTAQAGAGWKPGSGSCSTPGQNCDFMFANSSNCSSGSEALNVTTQGSSTINGNIQTNGNLDANAVGNGGGINGSGNFGAGSGCGSIKGGNHDPWNTGDPTQATKAMTWPIDYSKDFPACVAGSTCDASGYPKWCTQPSPSGTWNFNDTILADEPKVNNIYCAAGTGDKSDPSKWNGTITFNMSSNNTYDATFVGGRISYTGSGGDTISSCGYTASGYSATTCNSTVAPTTTNYPVFYATGADASTSSCAAGTNVATNCALSIVSTGNLTLDGDMFVPNGTAWLDLQGNQSAGNTFVEANTIGANLAGNFNGDGPTSSGGSGSGGSGNVTLLQ